MYLLNRNVDLREYLTEEAQVTEKNTTYDLVANVVHDGKPNEGAYRIHVLHHVSCCSRLGKLVRLWPVCVTYGFSCTELIFFFFHISLQGTGKWYEMQDLQVIDILPQMITLSEAYIQASPRCLGGCCASLSCFFLFFICLSEATFCCCAESRWSYSVTLIVCLGCNGFLSDQVTGSSAQPSFHCDTASCTLGH